MDTNSKTINAPAEAGASATPDGTAHSATVAHGETPGKTHGAARDTAPAASSDLMGQAPIGMPSFAERAHRMISLTQSGVEPATTSGQMWAAGCLEISKRFAETAKTNFNRGISACSSLSHITSIKDAAKLQTEHVQAALDGFLADSSSMARKSLLLAERTLAPISAHMAQVVPNVTRKREVISGPSVVEA